MFASNFHISQRMSSLRLSPGAVAEKLFAIDPDRDERASQICAEVLLTLLSNQFVAPGPLGPSSPKTKRFALRSLVLGRNFLAGQTKMLPGTGLRAEEYGSLLAAGSDFHGSENLHLARIALRNLIDPATEQGQEGQHLLMPFHEALLWYDARSTSASYSVRKVRMRGSGITLARLLLDPPSAAGPKTRAQAARAVAGIHQALTGDSPLAVVANELERVLPDELHARPQLEDDERAAWDLGGSGRLSEFAVAVCRHVEGVSGQGEASGPARLWQLRTILALDLAVDTLRRSWDAVGIPSDRRHLLLALPGRERQQDRVRLRSERCYGEVRNEISWATIRTLEVVMRELHNDGGIDWDNELDSRTRRILEESVVQPYLRDAEPDLALLAQLVFENASYGRSGDGFRVLLESMGISAGGTKYRYLSGTPDFMSALVGSLSAEMPMTSGDFFDRLRDEWGIIISPSAAIGTAFAKELDGAELAVNARRFERMLIEAGLASGLSDRTVLVGERAGRRSHE